jgi:dTDP-4-amino-4,6-dideoxygalactose transaminase
MINFVHQKTINIPLFSKYLETANNTNQFTNYGYATKLLEIRARNMLQIADTKAIIAVCNGAAALNAIVQTIHENELVYSQDFTFPCNFQIPDVLTNVFDLNTDYEPDVDQIPFDGIVIITNCFGHVNNLDQIINHATKHKQKIIFDNAASPYSFYNNSNISNYGIASYISLHHTKPIGFGEGGLIIIDKVYEEKARSIINFGLVNKVPVHKGNNYKMSEIAAASILQWWDSFDIDELNSKYIKAYNKYADNASQILPNYASSFFPNCVPVINSNTNYDNMDVRKYYTPNKGLRNSVDLYNKIKCVPITEYLYD